MHVCLCSVPSCQLVSFVCDLDPFSLFCFSAGPLAQKDPCGRSLRVQGLDFPRALGTAGWWYTTGNLTFAVPWVQFFFRICFSYLCPSFGIGKPSAWWFVDAFLTECIKNTCFNMFQRKHLVSVSAPVSTMGTPFSRFQPVFEGVDPAGLGLEDQFLLKKNGLFTLESKKPLLFHKSS